ncbi:MAG: metalloregulator ArsR/SmtB family transcription factor [Elusimicrobia bacterium]|nr:metalloregulator ArsR/SmtB family transcription factor [Elusimicrobiota bacterium]
MADEALVFKIKADFLKALAHPVRLALIERLKEREASVGQLVALLRVEQSSISKHLGILRLAGILSARQEGVAVFYSVKDRDIFKVLRPISEILRKKLGESRDILDHLGKV